MFPLAGKGFPSNTDQLIVAIRDALAEVFSLADKDPVRAAGGQFPAIESMTVDLSGSSVKISALPPRPRPAGDRQPGVTVGQLRVVGKPIRYQQSKGEMELNASGLSFDFARDAQGKPLLVLTDAREGHVDVKIDVADLQAVLLSAASAAAKQQGVSIQDLQLTLASTGERSLAVEVRVKARKMVMSGTIRVRGRVDIDDSLVATVSGLACEGEGVVGNVAASFIQPKLKLAEGRKFPLMAFSLGDVALRDLKISTDGAIHITAAFGH